MGLQLIALVLRIAGTRVAGATFVCEPLANGRYRYQHVLSAATAGPLFLGAGLAAGM